jgi:hypothetical protein
MSTTTHPVSPEEIMDFLDSELPVDRAQSVSTHMETCASCRGVVEGLQQTKKSVTSWRVAPLPAAIEDRIQSAAAKAPASSDTSNPEIFRSVRLWSWKQRVGALAGTAIAVLLLFSVLVPNRDFAPKAPSVDRTRVNLGPRLQAAEPQANWVGQGGASNSEMSQLPPMNQGRNPIAPTIPAKPMIARTVSLSIIAKEFDKARGSLDAILARHNGYAANLSASTPQGSARSIQASLRIPAPQLVAALAELKSLGRVELENQSGEEVTQQHADLVARLKNSRETEQRLQAILTQRTGKISDVLEVEQEIARVRGEIEQMEAEQKNLEHRVDFATIDLKLSEEYKAKLDSPAPAISTLIHNAAVNGYRNVADTLLSILLFFAEYGPVLCFWLLVLAVPAWLIRRRWRHATAV